MSRRNVFHPSSMCSCRKCQKRYFPTTYTGSNQRGGRAAKPLADNYGSVKDQGGRGAKRQTNKNHGTNRRGGGYR